MVDALYTLRRIEAAARRLALCDVFLAAHPARVRRLYLEYQRARATAELRTLCDRHRVERIEVGGRRVVRCGDGFKTLPGEPDRQGAVITAEIVGEARA